MFTKWIDLLDVREKRWWGYRQYGQEPASLTLRIRLTPVHAYAAYGRAWLVKLGLRHPRLNRLTVADTFNAEQLSHLFFCLCL